MCDEQLTLTRRRTWRFDASSNRSPSASSAFALAVPLLVAARIPFIPPTPATMGLAACRNIGEGTRMFEHLMEFQDANLFPAYRIKSLAKCKLGSFLAATPSPATTMSQPMQLQRLDGAQDLLIDSGHWANLHQQFATR